MDASNLEYCDLNQTMASRTGAVIWLLAPLTRGRSPAAQDSQDANAPMAPGAPPGFCVKGGEICRDP